MVSLIYTKLQKYN